MLSGFIGSGSGGKRVAGSREGRSLSLWVDMEALLIYTQAQPACSDHHGTRCFCRRHSGHVVGFLRFLCPISKMASVCTGRWMPASEGAQRRRGGSEKRERHHHQNASVSFSSSLVPFLELESSKHPVHVVDIPRQPVKMKRKQKAKGNKN